MALAPEKPSPYLSVRTLVAVQTLLHQAVCLPLVAMVAEGAVFVQFQFRTLKVSIVLPTAQVQVFAGPGYGYQEMTWWP